MKNKLSLLILMVAYGLLVPGLTSPMLTLTGSVDKAAMAELGKELITTHPDIPPIIGNMASRVIDQLDVSGEIPVYEKTRSILGIVKELFDTRSYLVGFLIMLFSVIVPVMKGLLLLLAYFLRKGKLKSAGLGISNFISKWSMADVFVVAILVAYLAANATERTEDLFTLTATLGDGFYFFLGYCLLSILSVQLMGNRVRTGE